MITIDESFALLASAIAPLRPVSLPLSSARGFVLAEDVASSIDLPPFVQSAMDGFAVRSTDTTIASAARPLRLIVTGLSAAGRSTAATTLREGEAWRIFTGAELPAGADAVIRQEDVARYEAAIELRQPVHARANVRGIGEELARGATIARSGQRLTPGAIGSLAMAGIAAVSVAPRVRVAIVVTGDEIVPAGLPVERGQVFNANEPLALSWFEEAGAEVVATRVVGDDLAAIGELLADLAARVDLLVTTGGASVGDRDHVVEAAGQVGFETLFWKVRQQPGKPLYAGRLGSTIMLGLPGNPAAVFVGLSVYVRRVLDLMQGVATAGPRFHRAPLASPVRCNVLREAWCRCELVFGTLGEVSLRPLRNQASHMLSNAAATSALARIPTGEGEVAEGTLVDWCEL
jgi:molybdopterin molybdotransferase